MNTKRIQLRSKIERIILIDAIRGIAITGVVLFHIVWDLEFTGFISGYAYHPIWLAFGWILAGTFMTLVGVNLALAHSESINIGAFMKRWFVIALAAALITVVTYFAFPESFIFFGVLHSIAAGSLIGLVLMRLPVTIVLIVGVMVCTLPFYVSTPYFNTRWLAWIGFSSMPPLSNDFVPIFPWVGLTLIGMAGAKVVVARRWIDHFSKLSTSGKIAQMLVWLGRRSLIIYLVHQPVLLAIILPLSYLAFGS